MRIRVLPSEVQRRTFELLGAAPMRMDLTEAIAMIKAGTIDAQENPFANTVTYGVHKFHRFHSVTNHFYISRPIFVHRPTFDAWPEDCRRRCGGRLPPRSPCNASLPSRRIRAARQAILAEGCEILDLGEGEHAAFVAAVAPLLDEARGTYGQSDVRPAAGALSAAGDSPAILARPAP